MSGVTLTEFLLARIEEDRLAAQAGIVQKPEWRTYFESGQYLSVRDDDGCLIATAADRQQAAAEHIARHDPARVLAECEADRRIVERHTGEHHCPEPEDDEWATWYIAGEPVTIARPCGDLRDLAAPYADHPGYREEWKP